MELVVPSGTDTLLRDLVQEHTGMFFDAEKGDLLLDKLSPLVIERGFHSFLDYYYLLKYDENSVDEWKNVIDAISVQETFFWREMDQINALVDCLIPEWAERSNGRRLRIWSAACATGEEPLTIAMALAEAGWFDRIQVEIIATDASTAALTKAEQGLFRERAFRNLLGDRKRQLRAMDSLGWGPQGTAASARVNRATQAPGLGQLGCLARAARSQPRRGARVPHSTS